MKSTSFYKTYVIFSSHFTHNTTILPKLFAECKKKINIFINFSFEGSCFSFTVSRIVFLFKFINKLRNHI